MPHSARRRAFALVAVISFHLALFWLVRGSTGLHGLRDAPTPPLQRVTLRLIPVPKVTAPPHAALAPPSRREPARRPQPRRSAAAAPALAAEPNAQTLISVESAPTASRAEPAASAPGISLLDSDATRRAIRGSARATSLTAEVARVGEEPNRATAQERLGNELKDAARGDCAKGEFAGAGMGLLSLPFLVAAAARGACAR